MSSEQKALFPEVSGPRQGNGRPGQRLFVPKLLRDAAVNFDRRTPERDRAFEIIKKWANMDATGRLQRKKERSLQGEFLQDVFSEALGYTVFSANLSNWNLETAFPVPGGEADGAIGFFSPEQRDPPRVVIELKGPKVNIDRHRFGGRTPVQQCWDYLNVLPDCPWGIVCNYVSFRLYHRNKTPRAFEHFTLQELTTDINRFREFYYLFERGGFLPLLEGQPARCDELLRRSENRQQEVGGKLYEYYHDQRVSLINYLRRPPRNKTLDEAIRITQKLLDRIIFIAFCEDRQLLNESTIDRTYRELPPATLATNPRWENFKQLFRSVDEGNPRFNITAFNGGLFRRDLEVDELQLDDDRTLVFQEIGSYDFKDEVNVEVLGHLFEQSITDLESLRVDPDAERQKAKGKRLGKRKREGIYYTPRQVTEYVVANTLGPCLRERFAALASTLGVDPTAPPESRDPALWQRYQTGRWEILTRFRVCDPACGSGAFLIEVFDFLEGIYEDVVSELVAGDGLDAEEWEDRINPTILRENLFGVDLSSEAVEITRLALWIRTAEKGKTLAELSENIQCGNSVIDDPEIDRAFDWPARFPQVFAEGRFDCVIGNPPYVKLQNFRKREPAIAAFLLKRYRSAQTGNFDLYLPFIERGLELLKPTGRLGMIAPNVWLFNEYGAGLRELVSQRKALERFVDFKSHQVFRDATTYTALQFFSASPRERIDVADASHGRLNQLQFYPVTYTGLGQEAWSLVDETDRRILDKMRDGAVALEEATDGIIVGIQTSADAIYHLIKLGPGKYYSAASNGEVEIEDEIMRPLVSGEDAVPFATPPTDKYLIFPYEVSDDECRLLTQSEMKRRRRAWEYLNSHEQTLRQRERGKFDDDQWYRFGRHQNIDKQHLPKLLVPRLLISLFASSDPRGTVCIDNVDVGGIIPKQAWSIEYLLGILNSQACNFAWRKTSKPFRGEYRSANRQFIAPLPIPKTRNQKPIVQLAKKLSELHGQRLELEGRVMRRFQVDFTPRELITSGLPRKIPGRLQAFDELPASHRLDELERFAKRRLKPAERSDWDEFLSKQASELARTKSAITDAMKDLNERIYKLFALSTEEILHIEAS